MSTLRLSSSGTWHIDFQTTRWDCGFLWLPGFDTESVATSSFNDWRFCSFKLVLIGSLGIFPDLGNATILVLWRSSCIRLVGSPGSTILTLLAGSSMLVLSVIRFVGAESSQSPVFITLLNVFSAFLIPFNVPWRAGHQLGTLTMQW